MASPACKSSALAIVAMGRSGTSLVSSLLQSAGLDIGQRLMGPGGGNVKGHFEDSDFYEFHVAALESQGLPNTGFTLQRNVSVCEQLLPNAQALVEDRRRRPGPWGWKDPRTTLFLDFWQEFVPEANFLILYRPPWDVVDSLFRRGDEAFRSNPTFAMQVWAHYNRLLLDFQDRAPRCLCVNSYQAARSPELLLTALAQKFGMNLKPAQDVYDPALFLRSSSPRWAALVQQHFPEAADLYKELNERARRFAPNGVSLAGEHEPLASSDDWAFRDWLALRVLEGRCRGLQAQLNESQSEAARVQAEAARVHADLTLLRDELDSVRSQLRQAREDSSLRGILRKAWSRVKTSLVYSQS